MCICSLVECSCHPSGSISQECNEDGECICHSGAMGSICDVCRFGFRRVDLGCVCKFVVCFSQTISKIVS